MHVKTFRILKHVTNALLANERQNSTSQHPKKKEDYLQVFFSEHPDVGVVIPNKQTIYIDAIRNLELEANYLPYESKARFFIVNDAEKLTPQASNALLKTLEEPSKTTYICLITSRPASLLPTIRSRCQMIRFAPVNKSKIESFLSKQENFSPEDSKLVANLSRGSIGMALTIDLETFRERRRKMFEVLECLISQKNRSVLLRTSEEMTSAKDKLTYENHLKTLQTLVRDIWTIKQCGIKQNIYNTDILTKLERLSQKTNAETLSSWINEIETLRGNLSFNLNRKIATDALFSKMSA